MPRPPTARCRGLQWHVAAASNGPYRRGRARGGIAGRARGGSRAARHMVADECGGVRPRYTRCKAFELRVTQPKGRDTASLDRRLARIEGRDTARRPRYSEPGRAIQRAWQRGKAAYSSAGRPVANGHGTAGGRLSFPAPEFGQYLSRAERSVWVHRLGRCRSGCGGAAVPFQRGRRGALGVSAAAAACGGTNAKARARGGTHGLMRGRRTANTCIASV